MKKNLLSVLILALLVVNLTLTVIMMVSVISVNGKTGDLVRNISTAMNLELYGPGGTSITDVPLSQTATYTLSDRLMIQLSPNADGSASRMIMFYMSLAMNTEHDDYEDMGSTETLSGFEIQIKDVVASVVRQYTEEELQNSDTFEQMRRDILSAIQGLFQSDFIYQVSISDVMYQNI